MAFQPNADQTLPLVVVVLIAAFSASFSSFIAPFFDLRNCEKIFKLVKCLSVNFIILFQSTNVISLMSHLYIDFFVTLVKTQENLKSFICSNFFQKICLL